MIAKNVRTVPHEANVSHPHLPERQVMRRAQELVKRQLADVEATLRHLPDLQPPNLRQAVEDIVASGGKRIRPIITLLIAGMFDQLDNPRAVSLASAVEMLHTATLVHDDLIDGSLVRRGAATLNAVWTPAATVLTGDYLFAVAANLAARTDNVRVMSIFADTLGVIVAGELQQQFTDFALRATRDDYYRRIYSKTASMFVLAATASGVICGASEAQIAALHDYGRDLGIAFQVMDDVLDFTGEQASVGKPVGSDLRRGLITLPTICYIEAHGEAGLECALRGECDPQTYDRIVAQIRASDAIACSLDEAEAIAQNAKQALLSFPDTPYRATLMELADYTLERTK
jgi:geranylgeranyl pyrophosphate synthase